MSDPGISSSDFAWLTIKPVAKKSWARVHDKTHDIADAVWNSDETLVNSLRTELFAILDELEAKFGPHPRLLATRADFLEDFNQRLDLYNRALKLAHGMGDAREEAGIQHSIDQLNTGPGQR